MKISYITAFDKVILLQLIAPVSGGMLPHLVALALESGNGVGLKWG